MLNTIIQWFFIHGNVFVIRTPEQSAHTMFLRLNGGRHTECLQCPVQSLCPTVLRRMAAVKCVPFRRKWLSYKGALLGHDVFNNDRRQQTTATIVLFSFHMKVVSYTTGSRRSNCTIHKSKETPTWCNTVQVLFLQGHSTCFGCFFWLILWCTEAQN